jgi:hypothetical protein
MDDESSESQSAACMRYPTYIGREPYKCRVIQLLNQEVAQRRRRATSKVCGQLAKKTLLTALHRKAFFLRAQPIFETAIY